MILFRPSRRAATTALMLSAAALAMAAPLAQAQDYPSKPITLVVPFAAGSGTDQSARVYGQAVSDDLKVPVVVDNKGGASGFIAAQHVAKAPPDGYTVFITTNTTQVANPYLFKTVPYDPVKDFTPIALLAKGQMLLLVRPDAPYKTLADLLAAAKKRPGKLNFGSGSSSSQVAGELLKQMAGVDVTHVPYKSNPQAITDLIGGQFDFMFADAPTAVPQVQGGKLRALAASGAQRLAAAPDVPTVAEAGVKGYDMSYWFAIYGPAGLPPAVVKRLNAAFGKASASPEVQAFQAKTSGEVAFGTPEALAQFQATDMKKWERVIRAAGIEPQ
ncbi:tripartite tricarboxylate transporter substrate binding protein [Xenophilus sp. Marseille-Q4582]|uniref:Bug family tripartite tricarboxylate transporter substrate binding protein n=1 Tax=Xenophilus sp. Marseille-Q4582 TaxID=2866600 RepID=UPI001CE446AD|nr:tripartite tricarboxylate transporter substrate binding protein [Xenophilus sp. Marseille-Q4582]